VIFVKWLVGILMISTLNIHLFQLGTLILTEAFFFLKKKKMEGQKEGEEEMRVDLT
jgi:hypothetical protein